MRELVKIDQDVIIVPKDFQLTNIGKVVDVTENDFKMKVNYPTEGIEINHICEFFSQTENGMLYFESYTSDMQTLSNIEFYKEENSHVLPSYKLQNCIEMIYLMKFKLLTYLQVV